MGDGVIRPGEELELIDSNGDLLAEGVEILTVWQTGDRLEIWLVRIGMAEIWVRNHEFVFGPDTKEQISGICFGLLRDGWGLDI